jgi:hypothetical protein
MSEPTITPELVQKHNLTPEEYEKLKADPASANRLTPSWASSP